MSRRAARAFGPKEAGAERGSCARRELRKLLAVSAMFAHPVAQWQKALGSRSVICVSLFATLSDQSSQF